MIRIQKDIPAAGGRHARGLVLLLLLMVLGACGFQLRGAPELPAEMDVVYIQADDRFSLFVRELGRLLEGGDARVTRDRDEATAVFEVLRARSSTETLSVNLEGRPEELRVAYEIRFRVRANGETLVDEQELRLNRDIQADPDDTLGSRQEARRIAETLEEDIAQMVLMRIEAIMAGRIDEDTESNAAE